MTQPDRPDRLRERLVRDFASSFIRIRGAHNAPDHPTDPVTTGEPCPWCVLAAEQAAEAVLTTEAIRVVLAAEIAALRSLFIHYLTQDSTTKDRRRRAFNQAIFNAEKGWAVWSSTDLDMVMSKFDKAARSLRRLTQPDHLALLDEAAEGR